ncbi:hypothetical protein HS088_TW10G00863 [Tripterygium wilfordii]|uniref:Uncharacterized protein n=1 Tax=Tripterygium wilfordii TaxID=458696 RepID=A0A7J7D705_TRIWF|nr:hypothetical protein HS088_TW10G00863 [Tripterygium wilfordii]
MFCSGTISIMAMNLYIEEKLGFGVMISVIMVCYASIRSWHMLSFKKFYGAYFDACMNMQTMLTFVVFMVFDTGLTLRLELHLLINIWLVFPVSKLIMLMDS